MLRLFGYYIALCLLGLSYSYADGTVEIQMRLLDEKAGQCTAELDTIGRTGRFCDIFHEYNDFVFKDSAASYLNYHMSNGDINGNNVNYVTSVLKRAVEAMRRLLATRNQ